MYSNCRELLPGKLQVKWEIQNEYVIIDLYGRIAENQYMAFGFSGANGRAQMSQGDVTVAFYDINARVFRAEDYFLSDLSQCDGQNGACPDERIGGHNDIVVCECNKSEILNPITQNPNFTYIIHFSKR